LADLIVPPAYRESHKRGLARYLSTGEPRILGQRIELTALRANGTEFPVELTVTRTESPGEPGFTGFVRDITERVRTEGELRSARHRIELVANEQAALRRVATLVARHATAAELFALVAEEVANVLGVPCASIIRYDANGMATQVGKWGERMPLAIDDSFAVDDTVAAGVIWRTGEPARVDAEDFQGVVATALLSSGLRFITGAPILVEGRLWGAMLALEGEREAIPVEIAIQRLQGFTELIATAVANATARSELLAARRRVIEAGDAARERVTRDIHDGAQQRFVNALINLQLAEQKWSSDPRRVEEFLALAINETEVGIERLRELAAGIHPAILSDMGLAAALDELVVGLPIPVRVDIEKLELSAPVQASVYFFCSEALTNVVKHARASSASVDVAIRDDHLTIEVRDDGIGGAGLGSGGTGLVGLADRIAALEGTLDVSSPGRGAGTTLTARIPC
jgi:signal transduction histidine kinase